MKGRLLAILAFGLVIFVITSGLFDSITKVAVWLVTLDMNAPTISIVGQLIVKYGTWIITFLLVGSLFELLGCFNSKVMSIIYVILSTVISFLLSWLVMLIEQYLLFIVIAIVVLLTVSIVIIILVKKHKQRKELKKYEKEDE